MAVYEGNEMRTTGLLASSATESGIKKSIADYFYLDCIDANETIQLFPCGKKNTYKIFRYCGPLKQYEGFAVVYKNKRYRFEMVEEK